MGLYPYNFKIGQIIQTHVDNKAVDRGFIAHVEFTNPKAAGTANVLALTELTTEVQTITAGITQPDFPRGLQIVGNDAGAAGNVVINGKDINDATISETIALNGTTPVLGAKAFKTITNIVLPVKVGTESVSVGLNDKLGLPYKLVHNTILKTFLNNALEGTAPTVTVDASNLCNNTVDLNSALNGNKVDIYLIV